MRRSTRVLSGIVLVLVGALAATTLADALPRGSQAEPRAAVGSGFTFQGRVEINGVPHTGACGLRFTLWDAAAAGATVGNQHGMNGQVTNGTFSVVVNTSNQFGLGAFSGDARWLETEVRCPNSGDYTSLGRTQLTPVPYATFAMNARDSGRLGGVLAEEYARYAHIIIVRSNLSSNANGSVLETTLAGISDATPGNRYLIVLEPGRYTVGSTLVMKSGVDIAGFEKGSSILGSSTGTPLMTVNQGFVTNLTIEGDDTSPAVEIGEGLATLRHVHIESSGTAVLLPTPTGFRKLEFEDSSLQVLCYSSECRGIDAKGGSSLAFTRSSVEILGYTGSELTAGVQVTSGMATITDSTISVSGAVGTDAFGVRVEGSGLLDLQDSRVYVFSSQTGTGILSQGQSTLRDSSIEVFGGPGLGTGVQVIANLTMSRTDVSVSGNIAYGVLLLGGSSVNEVAFSSIKVAASLAGSPGLQSNGTTTVRHSTLISPSASSSLFVQTGTTTTYMTEFRGGAAFSAGTMTCYGSTFETGFEAGPSCP